MVTLIEELTRNREFVLLGAGQLGRMTVDMWPKALSRPAFFLDSVQSGSYKQIPIRPLASHHPDPDRFLYILCFYKHSSSLIEQLFEQFLRQEVVISYDVLTEFEPAIFTNGWIPTRQREEFQSLESMLADSRSRQVLRNAVSWKFDRKLELHFDLSSESDKYDSRKYRGSPLRYHTVLDFGSYDGSFLRSLDMSGVSWTSATAFEPDPANRQRLTSIVEQGLVPSPVSVSPHAIWSETREVDFYATGLLSSRVMSEPREGSSLVQAVGLGDYLAGLRLSANRPSLIKLHVEGAEYPSISSIQDAEELSLFDIFVNLSHDEQSLLDLPNRLAQEGAHDLFLDSHSHFGEGLTLFARSKRWR